MDSKFRQDNRFYCLQVFLYKRKECDPRGVFRSRNKRKGAPDFVGHPFPVLSPHAVHRSVRQRHDDLPQKRFRDGSMGSPGRAAFAVNEARYVIPQFASAGASAVAVSLRQQVPFAEIAQVRTARFQINPAVHAFVEYAPQRTACGTTGRIPMEQIQFTVFEVIGGRAMDGGGNGRHAPPRGEEAVFGRFRVFHFRH